MNALALILNHLTATYLNLTTTLKDSSCDLILHFVLWIGNSKSSNSNLRMHFEFAFCRLQGWASANNLLRSKVFSHDLLRSNIAYCLATTFFALPCMFPHRTHIVLNHVTKQLHFTAPALTFVTLSGSICVEEVPWSKPMSKLMAG